MNSYYQQLKASATTRAAHYTQRNRIMIAARLLLFFAILGCLYLVMNGTTFYAIGLIICIPAFLFLMQYQAENTHRLLFEKQLIKIADQEEKDFFSERTGAEYCQAEHPYSSDLDVFGPGSFFHYINRTETHLGEKALAAVLLNPLTENKTIRLRQQAVKELSVLHRFMTDFRAICALSGIGHLQSLQLKAWLQAPTAVISGKYIRFLLWLVPALSVAGIILAFAFRYYTLIGFAVLLNWFMAALFLKQSNRIHAITGKQKDLLRNFDRLNQLVSHQQFSERLLVDKQQGFKKGAQAIRKLSILSSTFDQRLNTMLGPVFNSLFLFDLQCVWRIEKWKEKNSTFMQNWLDDTGEMEMLVTLGTYAANHPDYIFPDTSDEALTFDATGLLHPLIDASRGVKNDFRFNQHNKSFIITGSNMSGKSTFLRTLGLSLLSGMTGLPVNARKMKFSPVKLLSSMRISDSLHDHTSYFYAELKRLKLLVDKIDHSPVPSILFIDEMLKGTNSLEKLEGSVSVIRKLVEKNCISFIATHDLALGSLEEQFPGKVQNFSFESTIINNELVFDYLIKQGVAHSTNATFLLKKMGIV